MDIKIDHSKPKSALKKQSTVNSPQDQKTREIIFTFEKTDEEDINSKESETFLKKRANSKKLNFTDDVMNSK